MTKEELKQILEAAKVCRKAGIKSFKTATFEFTLTDDAPEPKKPRGKSKRVSEESTTQEILVENELTDEELLLYSAGFGGTPVQQ